MRQPGRTQAPKLSWTVLRLFPAPAPAEEADVGDPELMTTDQPGTPNTPVAWRGAGNTSHHAKRIAERRDSGPSRDDPKSIIFLVSSHDTPTPADSGLSSVGHIG